MVSPVLEFLHTHHNYRMVSSVLEFLHIHNTVMHYLLSDLAKSFLFSTNHKIFFTGEVQLIGNSFSDRLNNYFYITVAYHKEPADENDMYNLK